MKRIIIGNFLKNQGLYLKCYSNNVSCTIAVDHISTVVSIEVIRTIATESISYCIICAIVVANPMFINLFAAPFGSKPRAARAFLEITFV